MTEHRLSLSALATSLADGGHSIFAPSGSAMWLSCSGSLIPNLLERDSPSFEAAEGTVAHSIGDEWLNKGKKPKHRLGTVEIVDGFEVSIDETMFDFVEQYVDWCSVLPGEHLVEQRVYFSHLTPLRNQGGTADHVAFVPGRMVISDFKYGKGVHVAAEDNTQGLLYALGTFYNHDVDYDFQDIVIRIGQPRMSNFDEWAVNRKQLLEFADYVKERAHAAWTLNAPRRASEKACRWCKVKSDCAAHVVLQADLMSGVFDDLTKEVSADKVESLKERLNAGQFVEAIAPSRLTNEQLGVLLGYRGFVESHWKSMFEEATKRMALGQHIPGMKLVEGRSNRRFANERVAGPKLIALGCEPHDVYVESMCSPAEAEKLLRKAGHRQKDLPALLDGLVVKPPGKATMAPASDRRPAIADMTGIAFSDLTETHETGDI